ncbi:hypothetical protein ACFZC6_02060 [Streptomyces ossamyceticus]|uniref:hypothetical protein n=1 Tax=Streptomyces ossamyceticus TaxID=249581 RepID=UPI0036E2F9E2
MTSPLRLLKRPARYVRQVVAPNGKHRPRPVLLPDEPIPAPETPARGTVLTEDQLMRLLDTGEVAFGECAPCPRCKSTTAHATGRWTRKCWTCATTSLLGAS